MQIAMAFPVMMVTVPHFQLHDVMVLKTVLMGVMKQTVVRLKMLIRKIASRTRLVQLASF